MPATLRQVLELIATAESRGQLAHADTPEMIQACERLFDLEYVKIAPPGHRYRLTDAGRAVLAPATAEAPARAAAAA